MELIGNSHVFKKSAYALIANPSLGFTLGQFSSLLRKASATDGGVSKSLLEDSFGFFIGIGGGDKLVAFKLSSLVVPRGIVAGTIFSRLS